MNLHPEQNTSEAKNVERKLYEAPQVVYEGAISARAGSPPSGGSSLVPPELNPEALFSPSE